MSRRTQPQNASRIYVNRNGIAQAIAGLAWVNVQFNNVAFDSLNEWHIAPPLYYFQPIRAGYYLLHAQTWWDVGLVVGSHIRVAFWNIAGVPRAVNYHNIPLVEQPMNTLTRIEYLTPNDTIMVRVITNDPAGGTLLGANEATYFMAHRLS